MEGLVSLLDGPHTELTQALWVELEQALGLRGVFRTPFPHFSYQVARSYADEALQAAVASLARSARPLRVATAGLGVFTGPAPVLYLPVVRTAELSRFHALVWEAALPAARDWVAYYHPAQWMPHITLAAHDVDPERLGRAVQRLAGRALSWTFEVNNLAYIAERDGRQAVRWTVPLTG